MYYKIRDQILFRNYDRFGYLSDNADYGYRFLRNDQIDPGEKYVSQSGSVMLSALSRTPKSIDDIVQELLNIFEGVSYKDLKSDTEEFYNSLAAEGFLCVGETADSCKEVETVKGTDTAVSSTSPSTAPMTPSDFLRSLHIEIASACNERCVHCYIPHEDKLATIDPELFYRAVKEGRQMNIIHVTLSGGEPLLHPEIISFLQYCHTLDLSVNVLSNLTLLNDSMIYEMQKNPLLSVQASIYSMDPEVHDYITRMPGSLEKTKRSVLNLISAGIPVQISCPIMKENKDSFLDVIKWADKHNLSTAVEPQIYAQYDHTRRNLVHRLSVSEIGEVVKSTLDAGYGSQWINGVAEKEKRRPQDPICSVCRYMLCITATGVVYPCVGWQTNVIDTLDHSSLRDIWEHSEKICSLREVTRSQFPKCVSCKDRGYCIVCMMNNSNGNSDADPFRIDSYHCEVAATIHSTVNHYRESNN